MAKKHFDEYYNEVCQQYLDMNEAIKDMEKEFNDGLISPDKIDELKKVIEPLKNNYMTLSYVAFLLNKPTRKEKHKNYERQNQKLLKMIPKENTKIGIEDENKQVIENVKTLV